jgi:hypothetical protein
MYTPNLAPVAPDAVGPFLNTELQAISQSLQQPQPYAYLQTLNVAPIRPREGLIAKADGTHWNPGSGAGVYGYIGGAWVKFGGAGGAGTVTDTLGMTQFATVVSNAGNDIYTPSAVGTAGQVWTSNGAGLAPSMQAAGGALDILQIQVFGA